MANYDLIVIGGGPAGYVGAIAPRNSAKKVACVEKDARRRHLPELGLHPDQIAAAQRRALPPR